MKLVDRILDGCEDLYDGLRGWSKADHTQYFPIACPHTENVLALYNGSLLSVIEVTGFMGQYFPERFAELRDDWKDFMRNTFSKKQTGAGFDLFWFHEYDPDGMADEMIENRQLMIDAGKRRGLASEDILLEEAKIYGDICVRERQYLFVVTHIDALPKADRGKALGERKRDMSGAASGNDGMRLKVGVKALSALHEQHVNKLFTFMTADRHRYAIERLNCRQALRAMRSSFIPDGTSENWNPLISPKDIKFRATKGVKQSFKDAQVPDGKPNDWSFKLPPTLSHQMMEDAVDLGKYAVIGDRVYAPMYISELATNPEHLENLLVMCYKRKLPIRLAYSLISNSSEANYWNRLFASIFSFASASNRQISKAENALNRYEESNGAVLGYGLAVTTWAKADVTYNKNGDPTYNVEKLQQRARDVETLLQQWGGQQVDTMYGCSIEAAMSATPGYAIPPICPKAPQTEYDVITQLPIMRSASLWSPQLSMWFRTSDGVLTPYQPMSKKQNAMLTVIIGGMGYGKSNCMSDHIFYFANHPLAREMPYIRGLDFGSSSIGVVDLIRDSLPPDRKHEAMFQAFNNDGSMVKNVMDTRLCLRYPLADHFKFILSWLSLICAPLMEEAGVANVMTVLTTVIEEAYREKDPSVRQSSPAKYQPYNADPKVKAALEKIEYVFDGGTFVWEVVDALADYGIKNSDAAVIHAAKIAQRRAVPQLSDTIQILDRLTDRFKDSLYKGRPLTGAIVQSFSAAIKLFPCMSGITNIDIAESRVCVFDMTDVFGRGTTPFDDWSRSVFFAVALRLQTEDLFVNLLDTGTEIESRAADFRITKEVVGFHKAYLESQAQIDKIFWGDEIHRLGRVDGALQIIDSMALEGRKYQVGIMVGTQLPQHLPPSIVKMASTTFVFGSSQSKAMATDVQKILDLSDDERDAVFGISIPTAAKGAMVFAEFKTNQGVQRLLLHFQMGGIKRWAYATEADERSLRGILYRQGPSAAWARKTLATHVPDIQAAITKKLESSVGVSLSRQEAIEQIAVELLRLR